MSDPTPNPVPNSSAPVDWDKIGGTLLDNLKNSFSRVISGDSREVEAFIQETSNDALEAMKEGREDLLEEIRAQMRVRAERLRLGISGGTWSLLHGFVNTAVGVGGQLVRSLLLGPPAP